MSTGKRFRLAVLFVTLLCVVLTPSVATAGSVPRASSAVTKQVAAAKKMLKALKSGSLQSATYNRTRDFGSAWLDVDNNKCRTRDDILARDLTNDVLSGTCTVRSGVLKDPYTGTTIKFLRGVSTSTAVQIDHVIPLHLAWQLGANSWPYGKRVTFANDPLNLLAVDGPTNGAKSDSGPDSWLPPNKAYRCTYVIRFIRVAYLYQVPVTPAMRSAMTSVLGSCKAVVGSPANLTPLSRSVWDYAASIG